ncbi:uncharacterized protein E0L32_002459 [Thyridium curvatum]|uniref:NmrA-like domain-containing protein n=1 Tax=Thyridium curvatum TaxID=1093900 RepID=A0A507B8F5_9PEZI|nr:uncharacterized protein E0L32_002459 [Thyridium curvatum]TPX18602.1 hypothetical protein E0L32_002459 [Thyridium curvatum]
MSAIKNVAIAGAAGSLGTVVLKHLIASNKFNITILRRVGSSSTYDSSLKVVDVDFASVPSLTDALKGQDAVISTFGTTGFSLQTTLIDAAAAAGVKRFIPSEFGSNLDNPKTRALPVFAEKVKTQEALKEKAKTTGLTYTVIYNSAFLDWGLKVGFTLRWSEYKPALYNGGDVTFSATTLDSVADAVVGVLSHPEETRNRAVYVEDVKITQSQLLDIAKKIAPGKPWEVQHVKTDDLVAQSNDNLAKGQIDAMTFVNYIFAAIFDPSYGGNFEKTDNELLGLKGKTLADVEEIAKKIIS